MCCSSTKYFKYFFFSKKMIKVFDTKFFVHSGNTTETGPKKFMAHNLWGVAYNGRLRTTADNGQRPIMHNGCGTTALWYNGIDVHRLPPALCIISWTQYITLLIFIYKNIFQPIYKYSTDTFYSLLPDFL